MLKTPGWIDTDVTLPLLGPGEPKDVASFGCPYLCQAPVPGKKRLCPDLRKSNNMPPHGWLEKVREDRIRAHTSDKGEMLGRVMGRIQVVKEDSTGSCRLFLIHDARYGVLSCCPRAD